jgi:DNA polymerase III delta prime subunit
MYMRTDVVRQMHQEMLDEAQQRRNAWRVRALNRAQRRASRAEQQMCRARVQATRLRRQLEAEL